MRHIFNGSQVNSSWVGFDSASYRRGIVTRTFHRVAEFAFKHTFLRNYNHVRAHGITPPKTMGGYRIAMFGIRSSTIEDQTFPRGEISFYFGPIGFSVIGDGRTNYSPAWRPKVRLGEGDPVYEAWENGRKEGYSSGHATGAALGKEAEKLEASFRGQWDPYKEEN